MPGIAVSEVLVARQPICDRDLEVVGYELLYRPTEGAPSAIEAPDAASATVAFNTLVEIGFDRLVGELPAWVNVPRGFLLDGLWRELPPGRVVLEVLESVAADEEVLDALREAHDRGFRIALDDFEPDRGRDGLLEVADIVKLEVSVHPPETQASWIERLRGRAERVVLAEKVETQEEFHRSLGLGYDLFQGYFFCRPNLVRRRRVPTDRISLLSLMARLVEPEADTASVVDLVERDVSLSYLMLRMVNSAVFAVPRRIESIHQAVVMLGLARVKRLATLLLMTAIDDKPRELMRTALVRGRVCERLARERGGLDPDAAYSVGLLSVLDALTDLPMHEAVARLPLAEPLRQALVSGCGPLAPPLRAAVAWERSDDQALLRTGFTAGCVLSAWLEGVSWADAFLEELRAFQTAAR